MAHLSANTKLSFIPHKFLNNKIKLSTIGTNITYKNNNYILSLHHNLPIMSCFDEQKNQMNICINSNWSETIIIDNSEYKSESISEFQNKIPKEKTELTLKSDKRYSLILHGVIFIPFDNLSENLKLPYIAAYCTENIKNISGMSGSPVFCDNKLIGLFSKYDSINNLYYILPIYIIIKNIEKKNNNTIFCSNNTNIKKINNFNIKDDMVYHRTLNIKIPINTFFLIEGDDDLTFIGENNITIYIKPYTDLVLPNINDIICEDNSYKLTIRLMTLLKILNFPKKIIIDILQKTNENKELWFKLNGNDVTIISK
jgi:hypothetical protein